MAIHQPRLTATLPGRLTDAFNSLPRLETIIITQPTAIHDLPHPNSVRCMKLHYLPKYSKDWQWVACIQGLEEIDVSVMDTKSSDTHTVNHGERIQVHGENVECTALSVEGLANILSNLPEHMREKVNTFGYIHVYIIHRMFLTWN